MRRTVGGGFGSLKSTPTELINTLNKEINVALADPELTARLAVPARDGSGAQNKMIHFVAVDAATT
jgi:hypothetical protein